MAGPSDWFTGAVYVDAVAAPSGASRLSASSVHFTPGARTAWHTHPNGQTIYVLEGVGLAQRRGGPVEVIRPGDRVFFEPGEEHWHGAAATRFMTHLAMLQVDDEGNTRDLGRPRHRRGVRGGAGLRLAPVGPRLAPRRSARAAGSAGWCRRARRCRATRSPGVAPAARGSHGGKVAVEPDRVHVHEDVVATPEPARERVVEPPRVTTRVLAAAVEEDPQVDHTTPSGRVSKALTDERRGMARG